MVTDVARVKTACISRHINGIVGVVSDHQCHRNPLGGTWFLEDTIEAPGTIVAEANEDHTESTIQDSATKETRA